MKNDWQPSVIKIAAVVTAMPRWIGALLAADGLIIPASWDWWLPFSAFMAAGMAVVEGWAFAYIFTAWRNQKDKASDRLLVFAAVAAVCFVAVVAPYVMAAASGVLVGEILANPWLLLAWSIAVAASTISIVAAVGYAQKQPAVKASAGNSAPSKPAGSKSAAGKGAAKASESRPAEAGFPCEYCDYVADTQNALNAHQRKHKRDGEVVGK